MHEGQSAGKLVNSPRYAVAMEGSQDQERQAVERGSLLAILRFDWSLTLLGLYVYTFVIVTYKSDIAIIGVGIGLLGLVLGRDRFRIPFPVWLYAGFLFWAFLASFASPYPEIAREQLIERSKLLVVMVIAVNGLRTETQLRFYLLFISSCYLLFPVRGALFNFFLYEYDVYGRAIWNYIYSNPNDLGTLCLIALGISLGIRMSEPSRTVVRFGAGIASILALLVILLTQSRGAFLGVVVAVLPLVIKTLKKTPSRAVGMVVVIFIIAFSVPEVVWDRLYGIKKLTSTSTIHEADWEGSAAQRFEIQKIAWRIFVDHPMFGVGIGAYKLANARYAPDIGYMDTHNTYLNLAAEVGLPGLMIWCALVGSVLRYSYRGGRHTHMKELAVQESWMRWGFIGYLVAALFGSYAALSFPYLLLAVLWCSGKLLSSSELIEDNSTQRSRKA